jgi:DNA-binding transcriptional LysR family regulator
VDRLEAMAMFVEAVESGSFSAVGRKMKVPLPTVSRKIADLEAHLGTRLLIRSTRKLVLTDAGAAYVSVAKRILEQVAEAERTAAGEYSAPRGDLAVTAPIVFGRLHVLPVVTDFLARYPEINIRLMLSDRNMHLIEEHVDMAVRLGALPDSSITATRLGEVRPCGLRESFVPCGSRRAGDAKFAGDATVHFARFTAGAEPSVAIPKTRNKGRDNGTRSGAAGRDDGGGRGRCGDRWSWRYTPHFLSDR